MVSRRVRFFLRWNMGRSDVNSKLSSAHVYLRQTEGQPHGEWDKLPVALLNDAAQLVKANSIEGNKKDNITVRLPWTLLRYIY